MQGPVDNQKVIFASVFLHYFAYVRVEEFIAVMDLYV